MTRIPLWLAVSMLLTGAVSLAADETVLQVLVGSPPDSRLEDILYLAAGVELTNAGLTSLRMGPATEDNLERQIRSQAADRGATYALVSRYQVDGGTVTVDLALYEGRIRDAAATKTLKTEINLDLDAAVAAAVRDLIEAAAISEVRTGDTLVEGVQLPSLDAEPQIVVIAERDPVQGPEISIAPSVLAIFGPTRDSFVVGARAELSAGFAPSLERASLLLGAQAQGTLLFPADGASGGNLYMVAIGPEVQIGTADRRPSRIAFTMSGGAAILIVNVEGEALAKTVPFAEIGFAGRIPLGARASVGLGVKYHVVFEQEFLIMGVAPSLIVSIEP